MSEQEIEEMPNIKFKTLCKTKVKDLAFKYLQEKKEKHQAVKDIVYHKYEMAEYLKEGEHELSVQERQYLF